MAARRRRLSAPKHVASLESVLFYFFLGLIALFLNQDYVLFNEESFLALNSLGFFSALGLLLRKQVHHMFLGRAYRIMRVFLYIYKIGFKWLRKSVRVAAIGQWYLKQFLFSSEFYYAWLWRPSVNRFCREYLTHLSQQIAFLLFSSTMVSTTRPARSTFASVEAAALGTD